jgi:prepilin-type N-terminal cleavage/methylation domain-containing protein
MLKNIHQKGADGFTIVELLIASAVFSIVLMIALLGFLQVGRLFYKGIANAQTQNVLRDVVTDISNSLQNTSSDAAVQGPYTWPSPNGGYSYFCIGNTRYTYGVYKNNPDSSLNNLPTFFDSSQGAENMDPYAVNPSLGIIRDRIHGEGSCSKPCLTHGSTTFTNCGSAGFLALDTNSPSEMLGDHMRVTNLTLEKISTGLYNIGLVIAFGSNDLIDYTTDASHAPFCLSNSNEQQFCAVEQLATTTQRGSRTQL